MTRPIARLHRERMTNPRAVVGAGLLVLEAGVAALGVLVHYGLTAEYGNIKDSALEGLVSGFTTGVSALALVLVGAVALLACAVSPPRRVRVAAMLLPVGMVVGMVAVTPAALEKKLDVQYHATPQCVFVEADEPEHSPYLRAARESQRAYESIEHVVLFHGGGGSGVGGCDRGFVIVEEDVDVLGHYRSALPVAGWRIVEDRGDHLRAERGGMAFEVTMCGEGGVVWAGKRASPSVARCHEEAAVTVGVE
jgi:hypothetical protein